LGVTRRATHHFNRKITEEKKKGRKRRGEGALGWLVLRFAGFLHLACGHRKNHALTFAAIRNIEVFKQKKSIAKEIIGNDLGGKKLCQPAAMPKEGSRRTIAAALLDI